MCPINVEDPSKYEFEGSSFWTVTSPPSFPGPSLYLPFRDARQVFPLDRFLLLSSDHSSQPTPPACGVSGSSPDRLLIPDLTFVLRLSKIFVHPFQVGAQVFWKYLFDFSKNNFLIGNIGIKDPFATLWYQVVNHSEVWQTCSVEFVHRKGR